MSKDLNQVNLIGRLGKDPEVRNAPSGAKIVNFSIAVSETFKKKGSDEKGEKTEWVNIVIFGRPDQESLAEIAERYLKKGKQVFVQGQYRTRKWTHQDGGDRWTTEVVLDSFNGMIQMLGDSGGGRPAANSEDDYGTKSERSASSGRPGMNRGAASAPALGGGSDDSDIPF